MTTAARFAATLHDDGQILVTDDGRDIGHLARDLDPCVTVRSTHDATRYLFGDGSSIVETAGGWDIGLSPDCWCWAGTGHEQDCRLFG